MLTVSQVQTNTTEDIIVKPQKYGLKGGSLSGKDAYPDTSAGELSKS